ncbi:histidine phosphatase family protein [Pseudoalteromonas sp. C2R02]|uniref:histidine phosphatase family protein n=1 Tax=Pseudoalteromonas sp. C2R02 TaxID=2841565 RepID=UPI001C09EDFC|nr:phosphoglycerate mutase family protein [Pseudoalteromonas sp. C2R02]MBU2971299.1 histidine phosphatase family protein [Pseudoalteromonas sp. C2R02]
MKLILIALCFTSLGAIAAPDKIFLLRHAEKLQGNNPSLTSEGKQRAKWVASFLSEFKPSTLFSTDYNRTKETLAPLAEKTKMNVVIYNPRELNVFVDKIKKLNGTIVIAGHSNTTPKLAGLIDGKQYKQFDEKQFDRYFEINLVGKKYITVIKEMGINTHK